MHMAGYWISHLLFFLPMLHHADKDVKGWERGKSLSVRDYIRDENSTIIWGKDICDKSKPPDTVIIVCSATMNEEHRIAIRHTWGYASFKKYRISIGFLVGLTNDSYTDNRLLIENSLYEDMIIENFIDSYNNLTLKSILMLKWVKDNCPDAKYLVKSDDDIYIRLEKLDKYIKSLKTDYTQSNILHGSYLQSVRVIRNPLSKWYMPRYMFPNDSYPSYLSGIFYMMSLPTARVLFDTSFKIQLVHLEDVFLTGLCAQNSKIIPRSMSQFDILRNNYEPFECLQNDIPAIIYSHYVCPSDMHILYSKLQRCSDN